MQGEPLPKRDIVDMYIHASCVLGQRVLSGMVLPTIWEKVQGQQQQLSMLVTHTIGCYCRNKIAESGCMADIQWPSHSLLSTPDYYGIVRAGEHSEYYWVMFTLGVTVWILGIGVYLCASTLWEHTYSGLLMCLLLQLTSVSRSK